MGDGGEDKKENRKENRGDKFTLSVPVSDVFRLVWRGIFLCFSGTVLVSIAFKYLGTFGGAISCFIFFGVFLAGNFAVTLHKIEEMGESLARSFGNLMRNHEVIIQRQRQEIDYMRRRLEDFIEDEDEEEWKSGGIYGEEDESEDDRE